MKKRILAAVLASASILGAVAGCSSNNATSSTGSSTTDSSKTEDSSKTDDSSKNEESKNEESKTEATELKDDGDKLTILAWESNSDIVNMVKLFCKETGTPEDKIEISKQGSNGEGGRDQYQQYLKGDGDADLMCLEADWILQYINDDQLTAPLSALGIEEPAYSDAYGYTVAIGKNDAGVLKGASFQAAPGGFAYRADLAKKYLGVNNPDEMQALVKDWDTFQSTAKTLYDKSGGKTSLQATEGGLWQVYQANRTKAWVVDGKLEMDTAPDFYDIAKSFKDNKYMADVPQWQDAWYAAVQDGTALGDFVPTWGLTTGTSSILYSFAKGTGEGTEVKPTYEMAFCAGPTNYFWGGTWLGVSTKCDNKSLAKQFVEFFTTNADTMKKYTEFTGDFCNNKTVMKDIAEAKTNKNLLLKDGQDQFAILYTAAEGIKMDGMITKYDSVIKGHFNTSVQGYLDGTYATKDDAINAFKKLVKGSFPDLTVE